MLSSFVGNRSVLTQVTSDLPDKCCNGHLPGWQNGFDSRSGQTEDFKTALAIFPAPRTAIVDS